MTKSIVRSFAVAITIVAFGALGQAQTTPSSPGKGDMPMGSKDSSAKKANGEVTSVDANTGKLIVKTSTEDLSLDVQGSAKKNLTGIKVGDKVNVSYQDKGGMLVASSVTKAKSSSSKDGMGASSRGSSSGSSSGMGSSSTGSSSSKDNPMGSSSKSH
jgi:Cu/Ag efflux protein CusF